MTLELVWSGSYSSQLVLELFWKILGFNSLETEEKILCELLLHEENTVAVLVIRRQHCCCTSHTRAILLLYSSYECNTVAVPVIRMQHCCCTRHTTLLYELQCCHNCCLNNWTTFVWSALLKLLRYRWNNSTSSFVGSSHEKASTVVTIMIHYFLQTFHIIQHLFQNFR